MKIKLSGEIKESIVDGPGIRYVVFTQGCHHHCKGCHNPETHDVNGGYFKEIDEIVEDFKKYPYMNGLTLSGGEPFLQKKEILKLILEFKILYPQKNILIFTGFNFEDLSKANDESINEILKNTDYLIDGKFILEQRDISLKFRGSTNQRIIDVKKSLESNTVVEIKKYDKFSKNKNEIKKVQIYV